MATWREGVSAQVRRKARRVGDRFTLQDIYEMDEAMKEKYPNNKHIQATIRDNLQLLRDEEAVEQLGERGTKDAGNYVRLF